MQEEMETSLAVLLLVASDWKKREELKEVIFSYFKSSFEDPQVRDLTWQQSYFSASVHRTKKA